MYCEGEYRGFVCQGGEAVYRKSGGGGWEWGEGDGGCGGGEED